MNLVLDYEASALAAPQSFLDAMQAAANILDSTIQNNITVTIQVGYGDWDNGLMTGLGTSAAGSDLYGNYVSYTTLRAALASHETSTVDQTFVNSLPTTNSVNGVSAFYVPSAVEKALGLISPTASTIDGAVGIGTAIPTADLVGVALHEFTHAMGREPGAATFDLGRYTSPGVHLFSSGNTAPASYFSIDGGATALANYGQNSDPSDFLNSGVQGPNDPFNEFYSGSTVQSLSIVDKELMDTLGFDVAAAAPGGPSATTSSIATSRPTVTADGTSTTTLTVTVKDAGGNAVAGTAVTLSGSGSANSFGTISGTTNANGVFTTTLASTKAQSETITATEGSVQETTSVSFVAGAPAATTSSLVASSPTLTADGTSTTGLTVTVEDANGNAVAGTAVTLSGSGSANSFGAISGTTDAHGVFTTTLASTLAQNETITATEGSVHETTAVSFVAASAASAATSSIVASQPTVTADGTSTTTLTVTVEDAHGNAIAGTAVTLSGNGAANSFGAVSGTTNASGVFTTTLASTLAQNETITATEGSVHEVTAVSFVAGPASATTSSIVASQPTVTADGTSTTMLIVTVEDAHGNAIAGTAVTLSGSGSANSFGNISGTTNANGVFTTTLASSLVQNEIITATEGSVHETTAVSFAPAATVIQTDGSTSLVQVGNNFYLESTSSLNSTSSGSAPELTFSGAAVVAGQFGSWTPIGAVQVAGGGYDVAWKVAGADQYSVWSTDTNGNFVSNNVSNIAGVVSGNNTALQTIETTFHQDLNGDGVIGVPATTTTVIQTDGSTSLTQVGEHFYLYNDGSGPELTFGGSAVTAGEFGSWTPIGAVQVAGGGYDVAWKVAGADQYSVWSTDNNGNFVSNNVANISGAVSGNNTALQAIETVFHQDLSGDGTIGVPTPTTTVIQTNGSTSLTQVGSNFYLYSGGSSPELKFGGAAVTAGEFGSWAPIGAVQVSGGGYDVAWKITGADQYSVWTTDSDGNFLSNNVSNINGAVSGSNTALQAIETTFHQDLNGDGMIGVAPSSTIPLASNQLPVSPQSTGGEIQFASTPDAFVFAPNFGQATIAHFTPETDIIQMSHLSFTSAGAILAAAHDDLNGNVVISDAAHDTLTILHVTVAQLQAHASDLHIV